MYPLLKQISFLQDAVLQDALLAAGLIAVIVLVLSARRDLRREARKSEEALSALAAKVAALPREARQSPPRAVIAPAADNHSPIGAMSIPPRSTMNFHWRAQALRLLRHGQDVWHVSTALGVSQREIELLIRVHQLASGRARRG